MSVWDRFAGRRAVRCALPLLALALVVVLSAEVDAQTFSNQRSVGGVSVDLNNMLTGASQAELGELRRKITERLEAVPDELGAKTEIRKVSLKQLNAAIRQCVESGKELPDAIRLLGGLQSIQYVLAYPEQNDIVLVGMGEGWKLGSRGVMVGESTGRPVLLLDDLMVALRAVSSPRPSVMSCSIDPSPEGRERLRRFARGMRGVTNPAQTAAAFEQAMGPQVISVTGVPESSHFARVMVAADYRMKRFGMGFEPAPVSGMPSFISMTSGRGPANTMPRWWMEPDYDPLMKSPDGLTWEIRGAGVKAMTERDFIDSQGVSHETGKADVISQRWADNMTEHFDELALADPVFGQLQNCMDLAIAATVIARANLMAKAGCELPMLLEGIEPASLTAAKLAPSKALVVRKSRGWLVATGGVQINPWAMVDSAEPSQSLAGVRDDLSASFLSDRWWD